MKLKKFSGKSQLFLNIAKKISLCFSPSMAQSSINLEGMVASHNIGRSAAVASRSSVP